MTEEQQRAPDGFEGSTQLPADEEERKKAKDEAAVVRFLLVPQGHKDLRVEKARLQQLYGAIRKTRYREELEDRIHVLQAKKERNESKAKELYEEARKWRE